MGGVANTPSSVGGRPGRAPTNPGVTLMSVGWREAHDVILGCCSNPFPAKGAVGEDIHALQAHKRNKSLPQPTITRVTNAQWPQSAVSSQHALGHVQARVMFLPTH